MSRALVLAAAFAACAVAAQAQCPNGTPPPCAPRAAAVRRDPPLDSRTWIVAPFDNLSKSSDVDWLRDASVNLLSLDLSRWTDVRVVDDERVIDYVRQTPAARDAERLSYDAGVAIARRAGAGMLVMGDLLAIGGRTILTAKVFDVRTGARVRVAREEVPSRDSIIPAFGRIARALLGVAPGGGGAGDVGTGRIDAYREYLAGTRDLNRFEYSRAREHLERAIELDSSFALAHYQLSVLARLQSVTSSDVLRHAETAARLSASLPPRMRTLIGAYLRFVRDDYSGACALYSGLVREDSTDVNALYGLGECLYHDAAVIRDSADSTRFRFRSSWNQALSAFSRALTVDPLYHIAFGHILDILSADSRSGCHRDDPSFRCTLGTTQYFAAVTRDADTLVTVPESPGATSQYVSHRAEAIRAGTVRLNLERARSIAEDWVASAPEEGHSRVQLAQVLLRLGDIAGAERELAAAGTTSIDAWRILLLRYEIAVKRGHERTALAYLDSVSAMRASSPRDRLELALLAATTGRLTLFDSIITAQMAAFPPTISEYYRQMPRILLGVAGQEAVAAEHSAPLALLQLVPSSASGVAGLMSIMSLMGLRLPRTEWPRELLEVRDPRLAVLPAVARRDTSAMRRALRAIDSAAVVELADVAGPLVAVDLSMILGDTAGALRRVRDVIDRRLPPIPFVAGNGVHGMLWARAMLLRGDLAAATGSREEARTWYARFLELWRTADPEFAPVLARVRSAMAQ